MILQIRTWHEDGLLIFHKFSSTGHLKIRLTNGIIRLGSRDINFKIMFPFLRPQGGDGAREEGGDDVPVRRDGQ